MPAPKTADEWFAAYGESHQDDTNELIHWICVPVIFFCVVGLIWSVPVPAAIAGAWPAFRWSWPVIVLAMIFYVRLSVRLAVGLLLFILACCAVIQLLAAHAPRPVWQVCLGLFVLAWIGQFIGHKIEGKKPSFFHDVIFLLIGPAWLLHFVYRKLGWRY
ncbi:MAG TPA: Mpo1-like protein [Candidatus Didemnitutus sp.]|nr:Mpo1-like protein [Candidatus Didemnitutus sp.]